MEKPQMNFLANPIEICEELTLVIMISATFSFFKSCPHACDFDAQRTYFKGLLSE